MSLYDSTTEILKKLDPLNGIKTNVAQLLANQAEDRKTLATILGLVETVRQDQRNLVETLNTRWAATEKFQQQQAVNWLALGALLPQIEGRLQASLKRVLAAVTPSPATELVVVFTEYDGDIELGSGEGNMISKVTSSAKGFRGELVARDAKNNKTMVQPGTVVWADPIGEGNPALASFGPDPSDPENENKRVGTYTDLVGVINIDVKADGDTSEEGVNIIQGVGTINRTPGDAVTVELELTEFDEPVQA